MFVVWSQYGTHTEGLAEGFAKGFVNKATPS